MSNSLNINTYSLKFNTEKNSNNYYDEISNYTDTVLTKIDEFGSEAINDYYEYMQLDNYEASPNKMEILLEFLVIGVLYRSYFKIAVGANKVIESCLDRLTELRQVNGFLKKLVDPLRGILATILYQYSNKYEEVLSESNTLKYFQRLIKWLAANGEFSQEVIIMERWYDFLAAKSAVKRFIYIEQSLELANWFMDSSKKVLGKYTKNVESFLGKEGREHYWSEDVIFCNRKRVEYHLNMVGAEILNRAYREDFNKKDKKIIIVPACMRIKSSSCPAEKTPFGYRCVCCNNECNVSHLKSSSKDTDITVYIVSHESMLFKNDANNMFGKNVGIVGIACPLHLISGGWKSRGMNIPAQCVLLDYCGCKNHWDKYGIPTDINQEELRQVLAAGSRYWKAV